MKTLQINKAKFFDYFIIVIRFLLSITFLKYGYEKITEGQFQLNSEALNTPIKDLSLLQISWHLFGNDPFQTFIGTSQIICGIMLLINRTVLIGAILFLPIALNILIIDLTIMPKEMGNAFALRLGFYIFLDLLIFYHYKSQTIEAIKSLTKSTKFKYKHKIWTFIFIPILALFLEFSPAIPKLIWVLITEPEKMINGIKEILIMIQKNF